MTENVGGGTASMPANEVLQATREAGAPANLDERLAFVFEATFPDLPADAIVTATVESVEEWDSLQSVVLMTLLEEEFGITISPLDLADLGSYELVREYVSRAGAE